MSRTREFRVVQKSRFLLARIQAENREVLRDCRLAGLDLERESSRPDSTSEIDAQRTAGVDVKLPLRIATVDVVRGRYRPLEWSWRTTSRTPRLSRFMCCRR